jgi:hypothetical protein
MSDHRVDLPVGVQVELNPAWALSQEVGPDSGYVYQPVADTPGTVFVRYGPDATVDAYLAALATSYPPPTLVSDRACDLHGVPARRVRLLQDRDVPAMSTPPQTERQQAPPASGRIVFVAVGCEAVRLPFLVGYEVPERAIEEFGETLDDIIASVRPSDSEP